MILTLAFDGLSHFTQALIKYVKEKVLSELERINQIIYGGTELD